MMMVQVKKFKDTQFMVIERSTYRCYLAQGLRNEKESIYTGFVFLEWGQVVWNTTRKTVSHFYSSDCDVSVGGEGETMDKRENKGKE